MTPFKVFELNDWELSVYSDNGLEVQMPGFALVEPKALTLGEQALHEHRRSPLAAHYSYWHRLDASPLRSRHRSVRSSADLVFNQLVQLIDKGGADAVPTVFAVPSHYSKDQLALLLGIIEQTSASPLALIDASVAAGAAHPANWLLDVSLHQMTLTRLERESDKLKRTAVESIPEGGLLPLLDAWLVRIADEFVHETRFDPLRLAETEQQLWSRLYEWVGGKVDSHDHSLHLEVNHQAGNWHVNFDVRELEQVTTTLADMIASACGKVSNTSLAVTSRAERIPGLLRALGRSGPRHRHTLAADALIQGIADNAHLFEHSGEDGVKFVTSLSARHTTPNPNGTHTDRNGTHIEANNLNGTHTAAHQVNPAPTHLVHKGIAIPVFSTIDLAKVMPGLPAETYQVIPVSEALEIVQNGQRIHRLTCGSAATIGTHTILAIRIADNGS